jgi:hypothetical protein
MAHAESESTRVVAASKILETLVRMLSSAQISVNVRARAYFCSVPRHLWKGERGSKVELNSWRGDSRQAAG